MEEADELATGHDPPLEVQEEMETEEVGGALQLDFPIEVGLDASGDLVLRCEPLIEEQDKEVGEHEALEEEGEYGEYGEEEDGDGDGDGCGESMLQFEEGMDPMGFADINALGLQLCEQFQQLEFEAEAKKKRKAILGPCSGEAAKRARPSDVFGAEFDDIMESMTRQPRRRQKKRKGRKKGPRNKTSPEVTFKLGEANRFYSHCEYDKAIPLLEDVVRIAPNLSQTYHTLGLIYTDMGKKEKAMNFYLISAHLAPKDATLWKLLVAWSIEQGNPALGRYCLSRAITADPEDISLRLNRALLCIEIGEYQSAGESYDQIIALFPSNAEAPLMAAKMYLHIGQVDKAVCILEKFLEVNSSEADPTDIIDLLASIYMKNKNHVNALTVIQHARSVYFNNREMPLKIAAKEGICEACLGNMTEAEVIFATLLKEPTKDKEGLIIEVADSLLSVGYYDTALKYYLMLGTEHDSGSLYFKISKCYLSLKEKEKENAIMFLYKGLSLLDSIDARITLSSVLLEEKRTEEAISVLSSPRDTGLSHNEIHSTGKRPWWLDSRIRVELARIYHGNGMIQEFVDTIFPAIHESLRLETVRKKGTMRKRPKTSVLQGTMRKRLKTSVLYERAKLLENHNNVLYKPKPLATASDLQKAHRAKKTLQQRAVRKEGMKNNTRQCQLDWHSDESEDDSPAKKICAPSIPNLLNDEKHFQLVIDLCEALTQVLRNWEAMEIVEYALKFASSRIPAEKKEELRSIGAQIACNAKDPRHGYEFVRRIVKKHPHSYAAWNYYYKVASRLDGQLSRHGKLLVKMRDMYVPPKVIYGHQCTRISQHQDATKAYLEALKMQPNHPLILLSTGTSLINLALGFRLKNKHLTVAQGLAFLHEYLKVCNNSQEAMYNMARAYHHVGLVTLAAKYYEKVLTTKEKDYPIPRLASEACNSSETGTAGYCSLHKEAAYNLHLIYVKSGAVDLARQILKTYCRT